MSVPCSDTETRSASFWSFNHCLLSFTFYSLACWWFHLLFFLLQNAMLCFIIHQCVLQAWVVTSCLFFCMLALTQWEWDCPFRCAHHTLFTCLICCLRCVVSSYVARVACFQEWQDGKRVAQTLSTCHLHAGVLPPNQLRWLIMANAVWTPICMSPQSSKNHMEHSSSESNWFCM